MRFVGHDPSFSRTGACILGDKVVQLQSIKSSKKDAVFDRQKQILRGVSALLARGDIVTFEEFGISARFVPSGRYRIARTARQGLELIDTLNSNGVSVRIMNMVGTIDNTPIGSSCAQCSLPSLNAI
ncbi:MAG: hypothetical protein IJU76_00775 [Desulfovibrionaceae bacterium]|nr:hypothetical protein [Desulfovibrionaceae bacterium]